MGTVISHAFMHFSTFRIHIEIVESHFGENSVANLSFIPMKLQIPMPGLDLLRTNQTCKGEKSNELKSTPFIPLFLGNFHRTSILKYHINMYISVSHLDLFWLNPYENLKSCWGLL